MTKSSKTSNSAFDKQLSRSTDFFAHSQPSLYQTMHNETSPAFSFSTTKSHAIDFTPTQMLGKSNLILYYDEINGEHFRDYIKAIFEQFSSN